MKKELSELEQTIEKIEERYAVGKINEEMYLKFSEKYKEKAKEGEEELENLSPTISNFEDKLQKAIEFTQNVARYWAYGTVRTKQRIQNLLFSEGILIDIPNRQYLTSKVNPLFQAKADYKRSTEGKKKENPSKNGGASFEVAGARLELATFGL